MSKSATTEKDALRKAADLLGGQAGLAVAIGFDDRRHVWPWFNTDRPVPEERCPSIERATNGQVSCEELRRDVAWHRVPDKAWPWHRRGRPTIDVTKAVAA